MTGLGGRDCWQAIVLSFCRSEKLTSHWIEVIATQIPRSQPRPAAHSWVALCALSCACSRLVTRHRTVKRTAKTPVCRVVDVSKVDEVVDLIRAVGASQLIEIVRRCREVVVRAAHRESGLELDRDDAISEQFLTRLESPFVAFHLVDGGSVRRRWERANVHDGVGGALLSFQVESLVEGDRSGVGGRHGQVEARHASLAEPVFEARYQAAAPALALRSRREVDVEMCGMCWRRGRDVDASMQQPNDLGVG